MLTHMMRPVTLRGVIMHLVAVAMRPVIRVCRRVQKIITVPDGGRSGAGIVGQNHPFVLGVDTMVLRDMRTRQRPDAERFSTHGTFPLSHPIALADRAALSGNLVAWRVRRGLGHDQAPCFRAAHCIARGQSSKWRLRGGGVAVWLVVIDVG